MVGNGVQWHRYETLRPDQLEACVAQRPIAYWPLGLLEHHGWHLPVGLDGLKAESICIKVAERTGGVVLPTMWWGALGGHADFKWTHYQSPQAAQSILVDTAEQLIAFGFRVIVLLAGHYPWEGICASALDGLQEAHTEVLILYGTECNLGRAAVTLPGDHAAREETSYGLHLFPELVDLGALRPGHDASAWPHGRPVEADPRYPDLRVEPGDPRFAQLGVDPALASAERGEDAIERLVDHLAAAIRAHLGSE